jgi:hypothetical protein
MPKRRHLSFQLSEFVGSMGGDRPLSSRFLERVPIRLASRAAAAYRGGQTGEQDETDQTEITPRGSHLDQQ